MTKLMYGENLRRNAFTRKAEEHKVISRASEESYSPDKHAECFNFMLWPHDFVPSCINPTNPELMLKTGIS